MLLWRSILIKKSNIHKYKPVCGVGVNDSIQPVVSYFNGTRQLCKFYQVWSGMINRCYGKRDLSHYNGCSVTTDWLTFSNFKMWMESQDWEGKALDKDLIVPDNKVYSPETCVFITQEVNNFILDRKNCRGEHPIGVYFIQRSGKYKSSISRNGILTHLGVFQTPEEAHLAWRSEKHKLAILLSRKQTNSIVASALLTKYEDL